MDKNVLSLLQNIQQSLSEIKKVMVTKTDLNETLTNHPTKDDLKQALTNHPTKDDLKQALTNHPTKDDLKQALTNHPTKDDLKQAFAKQKEELSEDLGEVINALFAKTDELKTNRNDVGALEKRVEKIEQQLSH